MADWTSTSAPSEAGGDVAPGFRPELLVLGRQSRMMTQASLAKISGLSQPTISRLEQQGLATNAQLDKISLALNYPTGFFLQNEQIYGFGIGEVFHRRRKTIPAKTLDRIHAEMNINRMVINKLLRAVELPPVKLPTIEEGGPRVDPREAARSLRARWLLPDGPVSNVSELLERAGLLLVPTAFGIDQVDAIGIWPLQSPPLIFVNTQVTQDRLRLTLMHEVGHFVLHSGWSLDAGDEIENEANAFAAEFLVPERESRVQLRNLDLAKAAALKKHWKVSMGALIVRAKELGVLDETRYSKLWKEMGSLGYRRREPPELDIQSENPGLALRALVQLHLDELQYHNDELASIAHLNPDEFAERFHPDRSKVRLLKFKVR